MLVQDGFDQVKMKCYTHLLKNSNPKSLREEKCNGDCDENMIEGHHRA